VWELAPTITDAQWRAVRNALAETGERFTGMVRTADPQAMATADWTVAETAAHVLVIALLYTSVVDPDHTPLPIPELAGRIATATVDNVHEFNAEGLRRLPDRDPRSVASRLTDCVERILRTTADDPPAKPLTWLGESQVPVAGVLAHLLNELQIHGRDIARAVRSPWTVPAADAALYWELFFIGMLRYSYGRLLDDCTEPARERRIAVEFRSPYNAPAVVVLHRGRVSLDIPGRDVDVRVSFDPPTMNLMMFGRVSRLRAVVTGKVVIRGPRPWLLPVFLRTVHMPS
jgi:Mycothiol maleylpyruvate isomerase N-terminal domain